MRRISSAISKSVRAGLALVMVTALALTAQLTGSPPSQAAVTTGVITGTEPLAQISLNNAFYQQIFHKTLAPTIGAFYSNAEGVASWTRLFAQSTGGPRVSYGVTTQTSGGAGTRLSPYYLQTEGTSTANPAGITMRDRITYVNGDNHYRNDVTLTNTTSQSVTLNMYRYGDCFLAGNDRGVSNIPSKSAECRNSETAITFIPVTPGFTMQSGHYLATGTRGLDNKPVLNECVDADGKPLTAAQCETMDQDNGILVAYRGQTIPANASVTLTYLTNYAPKPPIFSDLEPTTSLAPTSVAVGDTFTYRMSVKNNGPNAGSQTTVTAPLPNNLSLVSASGTGSYSADTWTVGNLANGATASIDLTVRAASTGNARIGVTAAQSGSIDNTPCVAESDTYCGAQPTVRVLGPSINHSDFTVTTGSKIANGTEQHTITAMIRTSDGQPLSGQATFLRAAPSPTNGVTVSAFAATATPGQYTATVSSTVSGDKTITTNLNSPLLTGVTALPILTGGNGTASFTFGAANLDNTTVTIDDQNGRIADGSQFHEVKVTVKDAHNNPVPGLESRLSATQPAGVHTSEFLPGAVPGEYTALVSSTKAGTHTVTVFLDSTTAGSVNAVFIPGPVDLAKDSTLIEMVTSGVKAVSDPATITPDDATHVHRAQVTLTDANGNPVPGEAVTFILGGALAAVQGASTTVMSGADGKATLRVATKTAGSYQISATIQSGRIINGSPVTAAFKADVPVFGANRTAMSATTGSVEANGTATHAVTVIARDQFDNPVPNSAVMLQLPANVSPAAGASISGTTDSSGRFSLNVTSTTAGTYDVTATVAGTAVANGSPAKVSFINGAPSASRSSFTVTPVGPLPVNGQYTATVILRDSQGNTVPNSPVTFVASPGSSILEDGPYVTNTSGEATIHVTSTIAGSYTLRAGVGSDQIGTTANLVFTPGTPNVANIMTKLERTTTATKVFANGTATHEVTATVADEYGNPVPGAEVSFSLPVGVSVAAGGSTTVTTGSDGTAKILMVSSLAATYDITATVGGNAITHGSPVKVSFVPGPVSLVHSELLVSPAGPLVVGTGVANTYTATVIVRDANRNPISGAQVLLISTPALIQSTAGKITDANGEAVITLTSTTAGVFEITASAYDLNVRTDLTGSEFRTYTSAEPHITAMGNSTLRASAGTKVADGNEAHTLTATLQDAYGNPVAGRNVVFELPAVLIPVGGTNVVATGADGIATLNVTSTVSGAHSVRAFLDTITPTSLIENGSPSSVTFSAGAATTTRSTIEIAPAAPLPVGSGTGSTYTATITTRDTNGNPVPGVTVDLGLVDAASRPVTSVQPIISATQVVSGLDGTAQVTVVSTKAGTFKVEAAMRGAPLSNSPADIVWSPGVASATGSSLTLTSGRRAADGVDSHTATLTARDQYGNAAPAAVDFVLAVQAPATGAGTVTTRADGTAEVPITSTLAGEFTVSATLGGTIVTPGEGRVIFGPARAAAASSEIRANPVTITADGTATSTITVRLFDRFSNPLTIGGDTVTLSTTAGTLGTVTDQSDGTFTAQLTASRTPGKATVSFAVNGQTSLKTVDVAFVAGAASAAHSTITASPGTIVADGVSTSRVTVALKDANDNPLTTSGGIVTMATTAGTLSQVTDNGDGTYTAELTSAATAGAATISFQVGGTAAANTATVTFVPGAVNANESTIAASKTVVAADGTSTTTITVTMRDAQGNLVGAGGKQVAITSTAGTLGPVTDHGDGTYSAVLTAPTLAQLATVGFSVTGVTSTRTLVVTFVAGVASPARSTITATPDSLTADGVSTSTIRVTLLDAFDNPLAASGGTVTMTTTAGRLGAVTDNNDGTYTATLTAPTTVGTARVEFSVDGNLAAARAQVTFTAGQPSVDDSTITASPTSLIADSGAQSTVTVTLKDTNGNPITTGGATVAMATNLGTLSTVTDLGNGTYSATLTAGPLGTATISFTVNGTSAADTATVGFVVGRADLTASSIAAAPTTLEADGVSTSTITVSLKDSFGHDTPAEQVTMTTSRGTLSQVTNNSDGTFTATLTSADAPGVAVVGFAVGGVTAPSTVDVSFIDTVAPAPPTITRPTQGSTAKLTDPIEGTGEPGAKVIVRTSEGTVVCTAVVTADGTWACVPSKDLPRGKVTLIAEQVDASNNLSGKSIPVEVTMIGPVAVTVTDATVRQGGSTTATGTGFLPGEQVTGVVNSTPLPLGTVTADESGTAVFRIAIPIDFELGAHQVVLTGVTSGAANGEVNVVAAVKPIVPPLPITGSDITSILWGAAVLVSAGGLVVWIRIRRSRRRDAMI